MVLGKSWQFLAVFGSSGRFWMVQVGSRWLGMFQLGSEEIWKNNSILEQKIFEIKKEKSLKRKLKVNGSRFRMLIV